VRGCEREVFLSSNSSHAFSVTIIIGIVYSGNCEFGRAAGRDLLGRAAGRDLLFACRKDTEAGAASGMKGAEVLKEVARVLKPGGVYIAVRGVVSHLIGGSISFNCWG